MKRAARLLGLLAAGWMFCWVSLGLYYGDLTLLLTGRAPGPARVSYLVMLYLWLSVATATCWKRWGPAGIRWNRPRQFLLGLGLGLLTTLAQRALVWMTGVWNPPASSVHALLVAGLTSPLLACAEEAVFRGYLFGVLCETEGRARAYLWGNLVFASLHLFRPGGLYFKLCYGLGLFVAGCLLCALVERTGQLWAGAGLHSVWIFFLVLDPPGQSRSSWFWGLDGDFSTGVFSWVVLGSMLFAFLPRREPIYQLRNP